MKLTVFFISIILFCNLNAQNNKWKVYNKLNSPLKTLSLATINCDSKDNIWFGDISGRIYRFNNNNWFILNNDTNINNLGKKIKILFQNDTNYFVTYGSISKNFGNVWKMYHEKLGDSIFSFSDAILTDSNLILASMDGIRFFKDRNYKNINKSNSNLNTDIIHNIAKDKNGIIWLTTDSGLARWDSDNSFTLISKNSLRKNAYLTKLAFDSNNTMYIASNNVGTIKYSNGVFTKLNLQYSWECDSLTTFVKFDKINNLWIGTLGGFFKYDGTNFTVFDSTNSPIKEFNYPRDITFDSSNVAWVTIEGVGLAAYNENGFPLSTIVQKYLQNIPFYPNPVDKYFNMSFEIKHNANLVIEIYDIAGNKIATALNELRPIGTTEFNYDASKLQNGTYILKLQNGPWSESIKFVVNR